jgi:hypothetical protein
MVRFSRVLGVLAAMGTLVVTGSAMAAISATITLPSSERLAVSPSTSYLDARATITSTSALTRTVARVGATDYPMTYASGQYGTVIPLAGIPKGPIVLEVVADNAGGETVTQQKTIAYDDLPVVTIAEPLDGAVGLPTVHVVASCSKTGYYDCSKVGTVVTSGADPDLSLPIAGPTRTSLVEDRRTGDTGRLCVVAETTAGFRSFACREKVSTLNDVGILKKEADVPGPIQDVDATRILYWVRVPCGASTCKEYHVRDRATATDSVLPGTEYRFLTPLGAIGLTSEVRSGTLLPLSVRNANLAANGSTALYETGPGDATDVLRYRNTTTGADTAVTSAIGILGPAIVADNGDGVFFHLTGSGGPITRVRNGVATSLTTVWRRYRDVVTDGVNVAANQTMTTPNPGQYSALLLFTGGNRIVLHSVTSPPNPTMGEIVLDRGRALYRPGGYFPVGTPRETYLREADGTTRIVPVVRGFTHWDGDRIFYGTRSYSRLDGSSSSISSGYGTPKKIGSTWYTFGSRSLYSLDFDAVAGGDAGAPPDGGAVDAGGSDAESDASTDGSATSDTGTNDGSTSTDASSTDSGGLGPGVDPGGAGAAVGGASDGGTGPSGYGDTNGNGGGDSGGCSMHGSSTGALLPSLALLGAVTRMRQRRRALERDR